MLNEASPNKPIFEVIPIKILCIGDPHFGPDNLAETNDLYNSTMKIAKENNPDLIVCLGDLLDQFERIKHTDVFNRAMKFCIDLSKLAPFYLIVGNHDRPNNDVFCTEEHYFLPLKYCPNFTVVDKVKEIIFKGHRLIFVPYVPIGRFEEALNTLNSQTGNVDTLNDIKDWREGTRAIFAHQEFYGSIYKGDKASNTGDKWDLSNPYVFSGHIHGYQQLQSNILYVGSSTYRTFGNETPKSLTLVTIGSDITHTKIELTLKKKQTIKVTLADLDKLLDIIALQGQILLKFELNGTSAEIRIMESSAVIQEARKRGIIITHNPNFLPNNLVVEKVNKIQVSFLQHLRANLEPELEPFYSEIWPTRT